jgi:hypothetical protein
VPLPLEDPPPLPDEPPPPLVGGGDVGGGDPTPPPVAGGLTGPVDCPAVCVEDAEAGGLGGGGAALCRCAMGFGWVPSVAGRETGATGTTVAGDAVSGCAGGSDADAAAGLPPPACETAQPMTKAVTSASAHAAATSTRC